MVKKEKDKKVIGLYNYLRDRGAFFESIAE